MRSRRLRWPDHAEDKRVETRQLTDENIELVKQLRRAQSDDARRAIEAQIQANNERINRLMTEAKYGE